MGHDAARNLDAARLAHLGFATSHAKIKDWQISTRQISTTNAYSAASNNETLRRYPDI
jgi:hypothetical protein